MSDLYDDDVLSWSEQQAELLRRVAAGERVNDQVDWINIIDEVESLGRSETRACTSALVQMLLHELKLVAWPNSTAVQGWRDEVSMRRMEAADAFAPSMRRKIDVARPLCARAARVPQDAGDDRRTGTAAGARDVRMDAR